MYVCMYVAEWIRMNIKLCDLCKIYALMLVMNELSHKIDTTSIMNETLTESVCIAQYFKSYE